MAFKIEKTRGFIWTPSMDGDKDVRFKVGPLTPKMHEEIANKFYSAQYVNDGGDNKVITTIKSVGMVREQAKAVTQGWEGILGGEDMGEYAGQPLPCSDKYKDMLFDVWDDRGDMAVFVVKFASDFATQKEKLAKNSEPPSASL